MRSHRGLGRVSAGRRAAAVVLGVLIAGGITAADLVSSQSTIVIGTVVLAPFAVSVVAGPLETAAIGVVALALALVSGTWNHNFGTSAYYLRMSVVLFGGALAVVVARSRALMLRDRRRFELLAAVAEIADGHHTLEATAERICALLVPSFGDICVLDVVSNGGLRRLAVRVSGPDAARREAQLQQRQLASGSEPEAAARSGQPQLLSEVTGDLLQGAAHGEEDLAMLRSLGLRSGIVVPLRARGRRLGVITLLLAEPSRGAYDAEDLRFVEVLSGRVALALDNAGLFAELQTIESRLTTALGSLAEAVTVQNAQGNLIYANQAAADLLGYESSQQLLATPMSEIMARFESFREDGTAITLPDLPGRQVMAGVDPEALVVRVVDRRTGEQRWRMTKSSGVRDRTGQVTMIVNVIADITAAKRAELVQRLLVEAGETLAAAEDPHHTLQQLADLCVPALADWCAISLPDEHGQLRVIAVAHSDPERVVLARHLGERYPVSMDEPEGAARVFRDQAPQRVNAVSDQMLVRAAQDQEHLEALRELGMRAALVVPMTNRGHSVGLLTLVSAESGRTFSDEDVSLAGELGRRAATALENVQLYIERSNIAHTLQASLLPEELPPLPGWQAASLYRPAGDENRVGGDFYDAFELDGSWMLVVGDVTGRGAPAAALTALMRHTLRTAATLTGSAAAALGKLNRDLLKRSQLSLCTAVCLVLREGEQGAEVDIICAGHPLPVLIRGGEAQPVGQSGPLLGAYPDEPWKPVTVSIQPGDVLVLYSDGLVDAVGDHERFGPERLNLALAGADGASDAVVRVEAALSGFEVGGQADDTAVLAVQRLPVPEIREPVESLRDGAAGA